MQLPAEPFRHRAVVPVALLAVAGVGVARVDHYRPRRAAARYPPRILHARGLHPVGREDARDRGCAVADEDGQVVPFGLKATSHASSYKALWEGDACSFLFFPDC